MKLLGLGLKFIPTPNWGNQIEAREWMSYFQHVRRVEWDDYFKTNTKDEQKETSLMPKKLSVPKFSRPNNNELSEETKTYVSSITEKLRNLKHQVKKN